MFRIIVFLLASTAWLRAVTLTPENTPSYAVPHHPQLRAAELKIEETQARLLGAGRLQNPELDFGLSQIVRMPERTFGAGFSQRKGGKGK